MQDFVVLFPGSLAPHKGALLLAAILDRARSLGVEHARLLVPYRIYPMLTKSQHARILELIRREDVRWLAGVPHAVMRRVYAAADLAIFPYLGNEGFCTSLLEAMASGLPVVVTDVPGLGEHVASGVTGIRIGVEDATEATASWISRLACSPAEAQRIGIAARDFVSSTYTLERSLGRWAQLLGVA